MLIREKTLSTLRITLVDILERKNETIYDKKKKSIIVSSLYTILLPIYNMYIARSSLNFYFRRKFKHFIICKTLYV